MRHKITVKQQNAHTIQPLNINGIESPVRVSHSRKLSQQEAFTQQFQKDKQKRKLNKVTKSLERKEEIAFLNQLDLKSPDEENYININDDEEGKEQIQRSNINSIQLKSLEMNLYEKTYSEPEFQKKNSQKLVNNRIQLVVRIRPFIESETQNESLKVINENTIRLSNGYSQINLKFDNIILPADNQEQVFQKITNVINGFMNGINGTIFAYGQTGAGKTYSIMGNDSKNVKNLYQEQKGILPRAIELIFQQLNENKGQFQVKTSFFEIYNDKIYDLLSKEKQPLEIREEKDSGQFYIKNLKKKPVKTMSQAFKQMEKGIKSRQMSSTSYNQNSSRSHSVFNLYLETTIGNAQVKSHLRIVDLAGSEKYQLAKNVPKEEKQLKIQELTSINGSLSTLGQCIAALADPQRKHIPYRNSKLTKVLRDSLDENSNVTLLVCVSPSMDSYKETLSTLQFADRAKKAILDGRNFSDPKLIIAGNLIQNHAVSYQNSTNNSVLKVKQYENAIKKEIISKYTDREQKYKEEIENLKKELQEAYQIQQKTREHNQSLIEQVNNYQNTQVSNYKPKSCLKKEKRDPNVEKKQVKFSQKILNDESLDSDMRERIEHNLKYNDDTIFDNISIFRDLNSSGVVLLKKNFKENQGFNPKLLLQKKYDEEEDEDEDEEMKDEQVNILIKTGSEQQDVDSQKKEQGKQMDMNDSEVQKNVSPIKKSDKNFSNYEEISKDLIDLNKEDKFNQENFQNSQQQQSSQFQEDMLVFDEGIDDSQKMNNNQMIQDSIMDCIIEEAGSQDNQNTLFFDSQSIIVEAGDMGGNNLFQQKENQTQLNILEGLNNEKKENTLFNESQQKDSNQPISQQIVSQSNQQFSSNQNSDFLTYSLTNTYTTVQSLQEELNTIRNELEQSQKRGANILRAITEYSKDEMLFQQQIDKKQSNKKQKEKQIEDEEANVMSNENSFNENNLYEVQAENNNFISEIQKFYEQINLEISQLKKIISENKQKSSQKIQKSQSQEQADIFLMKKHTLTEKVPQKHQNLAIISNSQQQNYESLPTYINKEAIQTSQTLIQDIKREVNIMMYDQSEKQQQKMKLQNHKQLIKIIDLMETLQSSLINQQESPIVGRRQSINYVNQFNNNLFMIKNKQSIDYRSRDEMNQFKKPYSQENWQKQGILIQNKDLQNENKDMRLISQDQLQMIGSSFTPQVVKNTTNNQIQNKKQMTMSHKQKYISQLNNNNNIIQSKKQIKMFQKQNYQNQETLNSYRSPYKISKFINKQHQIKEELKKQEIQRGSPNYQKIDLNFHSQDQQEQNTDKDEEYKTPQLLSKIHPRISKNICQIQQINQNISDIQDITSFDNHMSLDFQGKSNNNQILNIQIGKQNDSKTFRFTNPSMMDNSPNFQSLTKNLTPTSRGQFLKENNFLDIPNVQQVERRKTFGGNFGGDNTLTLIFDSDDENQVKTSNQQIKITEESFFQDEPSKIERKSPRASFQVSNSFLQGENSFILNEEKKQQPNLLNLNNSNFSANNSFFENDKSPYMENVIKDGQNFFNQNGKKKNASKQKIDKNKQTENEDVNVSTSKESVIKYWNKYFQKPTRNSLAFCQSEYQSKTHRQSSAQNDSIENLNLFLSGMNFKNKDQ